MFLDLWYFSAMKISSLFECSLVYSTLKADESKHKWQPWQLDILYYNAGDVQIDSIVSLGQYSLRCGTFWLAIPSPILNVPWSVVHYARREVAVWNIVLKHRGHANRQSTFAPIVRYVLGIIESNASSLSIQMQYNRVRRLRHCSTYMRYKGNTASAELNRCEVNEPEMHCTIAAFSLDNVLTYQGHSR